MPSGNACGDRSSLLVGKCSSCDLVQLMSFEHVSLDHYRGDGYFPADVSEVFEREANWNLNRIERIKAALPDHSDRRVLDFGCGVGGFLLRARHEFANIVGFDLSSRMAAMHREAGAKCVSQLDDVPDDVDTVVLFHVLEHVAQPWMLLLELVNRFSAIDRVVIEVPNGDELLIKSFSIPDYQYIHYSADHLYYFTNRTLGTVVEKADLRILVDTQLQRYPLGNAFGWLADGKGGGQAHIPTFNGVAFHRAYESVLVDAGLADSVFMICEPKRSH